jgi:hypothetical protein
MVRSLSVKTFLTLFFAIFLHIASAAPTECASLSTSANPCAVDLDPAELFKRYTGRSRGKEGSGGPDHSDYPSDADIRKAYTHPQGPHVFYSGIGSDTTDPYKFSQEVGGVILRNAFPKKYLNQNKRSDQWLGDFWDRCSGIFAELAPGDAYFVSEFTKDTVQDCSIWVRIERPTLEASSSVKTIALVDRSNFKNKKVIHSKSSKREADPAVAKHPKPVAAGKPVPPMSNPNGGAACNGAILAF